MSTATPNVNTENNALSLYVVPIFSFLATITVIYLNGWSTKDLVWSLWLSSLVVGYITILCVIYKESTVKIRSDSKLLLVGKYLITSFSIAFMLIFFTVHFGLFHWIYSVFLQMFLPLNGSTLLSDLLVNGPSGASIDAINQIAAQGSMSSIESIGIFLPNYVEIFASYWPIALIALLANVLSIRDGLRKSTISFTAPYANVVKLHVTIIALGFLAIFGLESFWVFVLIFSAFYFPWSSLKVFFVKKPKVSHPKDVQTTLSESINSTSSTELSHDETPPKDI